MENHAQILRLWPTSKALSEDIKEGTGEVVSVASINVWKHRNRIADAKLLSVYAAAKVRGFKQVTPKSLIKGV